MQRDTFAGDIIFFYAYDVGDDIDLENDQGAALGANLQHATLCSI